MYLGLIYGVGHDEIAGHQTEAQFGVTPVIPAFTPRLYDESGCQYYEDGRILGSVDVSEIADGKQLVISEWEAQFPGNGHSVAALQWLRNEGFTHIIANRVGLIEEGEGDIATSYWEHMHSRGLVDVLLDDRGCDITPASKQVDSLRHTKK